MSPRRRKRRGKADEVPADVDVETGAVEAQGSLLGGGLGAAEGGRAGEGGEGGGGGDGAEADPTVEAASDADAPDSDATDADAPEASAPAPASDPDLARARALVEEGRVEEAVATYRHAVAERPDDLKARNNLGVLLDEIGSHELALEQFEAARELEPENVEVITNLGAALSALGRYDEAEKELRRAQRIAVDSVPVRASLGILLFRRGLYAEAEAELRWVCQRDGEHGPAHFYRGESLNRLGQVDRALEVLERAVYLQPTNARAFYTMGILYDRKHLPDEAQAMYRRARELSRPAGP